MVGVIDQYCPHRGANLWLGRNEECGIRCVYHGWKFDTDGACVDMPTSYPDLNAKDLIRIKSYPVREWGDMIWAYMGPAGEVPELPALEMALVPASHRYVSKKWQDCNWVQALEGSIDTAHFTFAHLSFDKDENEVLEIKKHFVNPIARMNVDHMRWIAEDPRPVIKVNPHDAGLTIAGGRLAGSDNIYWRIAQFLMPVHAYAPSAMPGENIFGQSFVPVTDTSCWIYTYAWNPERPLTQGERESYARGNGVIAEVDENYVPLRNKSNDYLIDRKLQKTKSYTGIKGVSEQDAAVQDTYNRFPIYLDGRASKKESCASENRLGISPLFVPDPQDPGDKELFDQLDFRGAETVSGTLVTLPTHILLNESDKTRILEAVKKVSKTGTEETNLAFRQGPGCH